MAFTFSTSEFTRPLADFGNDAAQMILQTGATIQQGLQQMMTNRQVASLGQELGQLNPESPEWAQQAIKMGSRYPLAMKSPAGQFMLSTQAKANAEWKQTQQATQQSNLVFGRQKQMEDIRTQNDIKLEGIRHKNQMERSGNEMMDLTVPPTMGSAAPASFGTDETQFQDANELPGAAQVQPPRSLSRGVPLFGTEQDITALAPAERVKQSLVAEGITKIPAKEFRSAVAGERRMENSRLMQEDRQKEAEKVRQAAEDARIAREERTEQRMNKKFTASGIKAQLDNVGRDIDRQSRLLANVLKEQATGKDLTQEGHALRTQIQGEIQALGQERALLENQFKEMGGGTDDDKQFDSEAAARKAGKQSGDVIILLNPKTGQYQRAKLK